MVSKGAGVHNGREEVVVEVEREQVHAAQVAELRDAHVAELDELHAKGIGQGAEAPFDLGRRLGPVNDLVHVCRCCRRGP